MVVISGALGACGGEAKKDPLLDGLRTEKKVEFKQKAPAAKMTPEELARKRTFALVEDQPQEKKKGENGSPKSPSRFIIRQNT